MIPETLQAQSFYTYGGNIPNNSSNNCFSLNVSGVGNLTAANGIVRVCLSIDQARPADLDIYLQSPSGNTIALSTDNGGTSGNDYYEGVCFSDCGPSGPITSGSNFRGVYSAETPLSTLNNGSAGDGNWQLCIDDDNVSGGASTLNYWSLSFGNNTPPASPSGEDCSNAYPLTSLPFSQTCATLAGTVDNYSACTGMMDGSDYLYAYTPSAPGEYLSIDIAQDFYAPSGFPTVLLLDTCPNLAFPANCIQTEIQFNSTENILHITSQPLTMGKVYFIVAASTSGTGGVYDIRIDAGPNGNDDCLQATVIDQDREYAGNNYAATIPNLQAPSTSEMNCNGSIDNFVFYTFTTDALGSTVYVNVTDIDCDISCGGSCGIQLALFQAPPGGACLGAGNWGSPVYCEPSTETNVYYAWNGLLPNTQYYLMVDGNAGSQCVWNLRVMGDYLTILPVEIASIRAENIQEGNEVSWTTAAQSNLSHYIVEHSLSLGEGFEEAGQVEARPGSENSYRFLHSRPGKGMHYYRLKSVDLDGQISYSEIVTAEVVSDLPAVQLFPNPVQGQVFLRSEISGTASLEVMSLTGQSIRKMQLAEGELFGTLRLDVGDLGPGMYLLKLRSEEGEQVLKFSKI